MWVYSYLLPKASCEQWIHIVSCIFKLETVLVLNLLLAHIDVEASTLHLDCFTIAIKLDVLEFTSISIRVDASN